MDDAELALREHENMIASFAIAGSQVDGAVIRRADGVALIATGLSLRALNQVIVYADDATAAAVAAAVAVTRGRCDRFVVSLRVGADDRLVPLMAELGLVPMSDEPPIPGMALHPIPAGPLPTIPAGPLPTIPGHAIRRVTDVAGLHDHVRTAAAGFEMDEATIRAFMGPGLLGRPDTAVYVGYAEGEAVTAGLGIRTGDTIGVYNIATRETARRRGYGAAMTARIAADGAADGCDVAVLQASPMGLSTYERLGYRTVVRYTWYAEPGDPGDGDEPRGTPQAD